jgi:hypothetical protein
MMDRVMWRMADNGDSGGGDSDDDSDGDDDGAGGLMLVAELAVEAPVPAPRLALFFRGGITFECRFQNCYVTARGL